MRFGGRKEGTPNKRTADLQELADKNDANPILFFMLVMTGDLRKLGFHFGDDYNPESPENLIWDKKLAAFRPRHVAPLELRMEAAKELAPYLEAKRKSVEIVNDEKPEPPKFTINLSPQKVEG